MLNFACTYTQNTIPHSGFHTITQGFKKMKEEISSMAWSDRRSMAKIIFALQQMFPASEEKLNEVKLVTESYHKYKREFVKHLFFNPDHENLSECFYLTSI